VSIDAQIRADILRLHHIEKWPIGTIARQLRVHHSSVSRVINQTDAKGIAKARPRKVDAFLALIEEILMKFPVSPQRASTLW